MKAIILCAGLGTRLRPLTETTPKVMIPIGGKPLLQHHIEWLVGNGTRDIGINLFYLPESITSYFGDGSRFGARIHYSLQETLSEPASGFKKFKDFIGSETSLVVYGDNMFFLDIADFLKYHQEKKGMVSIALKRWENPSAKGIVGLDEENRILWFKEKPQLHEIVTDVGNAGIYLVEPELFSHIPDDRDYDFGKDIFPSLLVKEKKMHGYHLTGYHIDIGTPEALEKARADYPALYSNKAVFLDRDGVLNKKAAEHDYVNSFEEFSWNAGAMELIKKIKSLGYKAIVVSNQQGIAKGKMSEEFVKSLHAKMNRDLEKMGTQIDGFYYCPHLESDHCTCRKPKPGLMFKAAEDFKINLENSWMIGDTQSDIEAGQRAGCSTIKTQSDVVDVDAIATELLRHTIPLGK